MKTIIKRLFVLAIIVALFASFSVFAAVCSSMSATCKYSNSGKSITGTTKCNHTTGNGTVKADVTGRYKIGTDTTTYVGYAYNESDFNTSATFRYSGNSSISFLSNSYNYWTVFCGTCGSTWAHGYEYATPQ